MTSGLRIFGSLSAILLLGATIAGCGDDDDSNASSQSGYDAGPEAGSSGKTSTAGRGGAGGNTRVIAGRGGSTGATAGRSAAGSGGATPIEGGGQGGGTAGVGGNIAPPSGGSGSASALLTDAQIAAVTTAANTGEIALGNLAVGRARLPEVRAFAQEMVTMHGAAQSRSSALLETLSTIPVASNLSTSLEQDAQRVSAMLENASAADFDLAYIQSQVQIHTQVLEIFDEVLIPSVSSPAIRTDLSLARADVQQHLTEAQALLVIVQNAPPLADDAGVDDAGL
jgi:putative membrane protein